MLRVSFAALFLIAGAVRADDAPNLEWKELPSETGRFKALFPGTAKKLDQDLPTAIGRMRTYIFVVEISEDFIFMVSYCDYPASITKSDPMKVLKSVARGQKGDSELLLHQEITLGKDKIPGYEIISNQGAAATRSRAYLDKNRLYQVMVLGKSKEVVTSKDAEKFLDSFEITP